MTRPDLPVDDDQPDGVAEEDAAIHARFQRPPPGKPALLPEEPPRALDDTPVASGLLSLEDTGEFHVPPRAVLSSDEAALLAASRRAVMGAAFALPLLIIFGLFGLMLALTDDEPSPAAPATGTALPGTALIAPTAEPGPPVDAVWPADLTYAAHTVPALIKDEIAYAGAQMGYRFSGQAESEWAITVEASDDLFDPQVTLYAPSGGVVATNDNRAAGITAADLIVTLPETGDYRVLVESSAAVPSTGSYLLAVFER